MSDNNGTTAKPARQGNVILARQANFEANLTRPFEPHVFATGSTIARSAIAVQDRVQDRETKEWSDGPTEYVDLLLFERLVDNACASFAKGDRVVVTGQLRKRFWAKDDGTEGSVLELVVDSIGFSTRFSQIVQTEKVTRSKASVGAPVPEDLGGYDIR